MNCANHPDVNASAFCRDCGKPMCAECQRPALGSVFCQEHVPMGPAPDPAPAGTSSFSGSPYSKSPYSKPESAGTAWSAPAGHVPAGGTPATPAAPLPGVHPILALILGFAPGIGAIYNGQYAKGLIHAVIFGVLISLANNTHNGGMEGFLGVMIATWVIYQAIEAFHTARKRRYGMEVEEFSSLFDGRHHHGRFPVGAIVLILVGFVLLLNTTELIDMEQVERYWPLLLIGVGIYMLYVRLNPAADAHAPHSGNSNGGVR